MYIMGLNLGHDLTVCILKDGELIYAHELERDTRVNGHTVLPEVPTKIKAGYGMEGCRPLQNPRGLLAYIDKALDRCNLTLEDISFVGLSEGGYEYAYAAHIAPYFSPDQIFSIPHHECHAAASFFLSPFKEASVLTIDGFGCDGNMSHGVGKENKLSFFYKNWLRDDTAMGDRWMYTNHLFCQTKFLHGGVGGGGAEGTIMAAAGLPEGDTDEIKKLEEIFYNGFIFKAPEYDRETKYIVCEEYRDKVYYNYRAKFEHIPSLSGKEAEKERKRLFPTYVTYCTALQNATERAIQYWVEKVGKHTHITDFCLNGGVMLNSVAVGKLYDKFPDFRFWVGPSVNDGAQAIGAGLYAGFQSLNNPRRCQSVVPEYPYRKIQSPHLGPTYKSSDILRALHTFNRSHRENIQFSYAKATRKELANAIYETSSSAMVWHGRSPIGRRSLGNRSILADPRDPGLKKFLNTEVKHRIEYRPYAPAVLEEKMSDLFEVTHPSPYMELTLPYKKEVEQKYPAIGHHTGRGRPQTVDINTYPWFHGLLLEWYQLTGCPVLLNTSFNIHEPIVESPQDALRTGMRSGVDYLWLGGYLCQVENGVHIGDYLTPREEKITYQV